MGKHRITEIRPVVHIPDGQHMQANYFCLDCHAVGSLPKHYGGCTSSEVYAIPAHAEVPRRRASKRTWEIFKRSWVYVRPVGYWHYASECWYWKNNCAEK